MIKLSSCSKLALIIYLFLLISCEKKIAQHAAPGHTEPKALFIIMDGISADVLESVETPNIDRIIEEGSYSRAWLGGEFGGYSESPTVSAVGYNHVLAGVWSNKHNVYNNDIEAPNYNYWNIFRLFKNNNPEEKVAIYSSWLDNRTKLVGDELSEAGGFSVDIHYDGFDTDTLSFPHEPGYVQKIDDHVSTLAAQSIRNDAPYLSWVYLWYTDDTGHNYGDSEEYFESIRVADEQVGRVWEAVEYREENFNEYWLVVITTDHGRRLPDGRGHGGHSERERTTWIVTNLVDVNSYFEETKPAAVDIYPTISRHLELEIPQSLQWELDGVPFKGEVSISDPEVSYNPSTQTIDVKWVTWDEAGDVEIWLAMTNEFKMGTDDEYQFITKVPVSAGEATISTENYSSDFYKIVLDAPHNSLNRWIVETDIP